MNTHSIVVLRRNELDSLELSWGEIISALEGTLLRREPVR